jgi:hypothetical protein
MKVLLPKATELRREVRLTFFLLSIDVPHHILHSGTLRLDKLLSRMTFDATQISSAVFLDVPMVSGTRFASTRYGHMN